MSGQALELLESPSLGVSKECRDVALRDVVRGHGGVGRSDFRGFFSTLKDSVIL